MRFICNTCEGYAYEIRTRNEEELAGLTFIRNDQNGNIQIRYINAYDFTLLVEMYKKKNDIKDYEYRTVTQNNDFYIALTSPDFRKIIMLAHGEYMDVNIASADIDEDVLKFMNYFFDYKNCDVLECYKEYNSIFKKIRGSK